MQYRYYKGRPEAHRLRQRERLKWLLGFLFMFVGPPLILSGWAFFAGLRWLWRPNPSVGTVLNTAIFFLLCCYIVSRRRTSKSCTLLWRGLVSTEYPPACSFALNTMPGVSRNTT